MACYSLFMPVLAMVMVALTFGVVLYFQLTNKKRVAAAAAKHGDARAGALAERMGLQVVAGDPTTNLMFARAQNTNSKGEMPEVYVRLEGTPGGRFTEVEYYQRIDVKREFRGAVITSWLTAHIGVQVRSPFPEFEILLRNPNQYDASDLKPKLLTPPVPIGDPSLDAFLLLKTGDPRVAAALVEPLRTVSGWGWVHVHGDGDKLRFYCTRQTASYMGVADQIQAVLSAMAENLERVAAAHGAAVVHGAA